MQLQRDAANSERAEAARPTLESDRDCFLGQARMSKAAGNLAGEHRTDGAVNVGDRKATPTRSPGESGFRQNEQLMIERLLESMILLTLRRRSSVLLTEADSGM